MVHYMQRERLRTLDYVKKIIDSQTEYNEEKTIRSIMTSIGCTALRAKIYLDEVLYK